jgi:integrase
LPRVDGAQNKHRLKVGSAWQDHDLIFALADGGPIWPDHLTHRFSTLMKEAKVTPIRLHDLRHTHATLLLKEGVHLKIVSERLGHGGIQVTADVYSHVTPDMHERAAVGIDAALFGGTVKAAVN